MKHIRTLTLAMTATTLWAGAAIPEGGGEASAVRFEENRQGRAVMANPYDDVVKIQRAQAVGENELKIRELYQQSAKASYDSSAKIKAQLASIKASYVDPDARNNLLNLDVPPIEVERISRDEVVRERLVPSLSMIERGDETFGEPKNLFLNDWELTRSADGETYVGRTGDPLSRLNVRVGMILGEFGRIMAVRDTGDAFYLILESGDRIQGKQESWRG